MPENKKIIVVTFDRLLYSNDYPFKILYNEDCIYLIETDVELKISQYIKGSKILRIYDQRGVFNYLFVNTTRVNELLRYK